MTLRIIFCVLYNEHSKQILVNMNVTYIINLYIFYTLNTLKDIKISVTEENRYMDIIQEGSMFSPSHSIICKSVRYIVSIIDYPVKQNIQ